MESIERAKGSWWWVPAVGVVYIWVGAAALEIVNTLCQILSLPSAIARASLIPIALGLPVSLIVAARAKKMPTRHDELRGESAESRISVLEEERDFYRAIVEGPARTQTAINKDRPDE